PDYFRRFDRDANAVLGRSLADQYDIDFRIGQSAKDPSTDTDHLHQSWALDVQQGNVTQRRNAFDQFAFPGSFTNKGSRMAWFKGILDIDRNFLPHGGLHGSGKHHLGTKMRQFHCLIVTELWNSNGRI